MQQIQQPLQPSLEHVCQNHHLAHSILAFLKAPDVRKVRLVSQVLRAAANAAVTTLQCSTRSPNVADLARRFPNAEGLRISFDASARSNPSAFSLFNSYTVLQHVAAGSPEFLTKLVRLDVDMGNFAPSAFHDYLALFLARCTSLQELSVTARPAGAQIITHFKGHGSTPEQRRTHMQQQLAAICTSPHFLAPASWPTHQCLDSIAIYGHSQTADLNVDTLARVAPQTASLRTLLVAGCTAASLPAWQGFSSLLRLTSLTLDCVEDFDDVSLQQCQSTVAAVARLTALARLSIDPRLLLSSPDATAFSIPACWTQLSSLTQLRLTYWNTEEQEDWGEEINLRLQAAPVPCLPALQQLTLRTISTRGMTCLFPLTALTSLDRQGLVWKEEEGASEVPQQGLASIAVPQQWKDGLQKLAWEISNQDMLARDLVVITQLSRLVRLELKRAVMTPFLCCSLASLPCLRHLVVGDVNTNASAQNDTAPTGPALRPAFRALQVLEYSDVEVLHMMAAWTCAPAGLVLAANHSRVHIVPVGRWGAGWLAAVLALHASKNRYYISQGPAYWLEGCACADAFVQAMGNTLRSSAATRTVPGLPAEQPPFIIVLGSGVSSAGFRRLITGGPERLRIASSASTDIQVPALPGVQALSRDCFQLLPGTAAPQLQVLHIDDCSNLGLVEFAALVTAVPNLKRLVLPKAPAASDAMVCMLVACPRLAVLELGAAESPCSHVTHEGVLVLLRTLQQLKHVVVHGLGHGAVLSSLPSAIVNSWEVSGSDAHVIVSKPGWKWWLLCSLRAP